jgi:hypothetical protein
MLGVRLFAVAVVAFMLVLPVVAQDESPDTTTPAVGPSDPTVDEAPPNEQPSPQPAVPTATPAPAVTGIPGPGSVVVTDNFDDVTRPNFPLSTSDPNARSQGYIDGEYEIISGGGPASALVPGTYSNSTIAVEVRLTDGPIAARAFVACRRVGANEGYQFNIVPEQTAPNVRSDFVGPRFQLIKLRDGPDVLLIDQGPSAVIRGKGEVNRIELTCEGSTITGRVNGEEVFAVLDSSYTAGRHRFGVAGVQTRGRFDNLTVILR